MSEMINCMVSKMRDALDAVGCELDTTRLEIAARAALYAASASVNVVQWAPDDDTPGAWIGFATSDDRRRAYRLLTNGAPPTSV